VTTVTVRIDRVDTTTADESVLRILHDLWNGFEAEELPDELPRPYEERKVHFRHPHSTRFYETFLLHDDEAPAGFAEVKGGMVENLENAELMLFVAPGFRGRGHARRLAAEALAVMDDRQRIRFDVGVVEGWPMGTLLADLGMKYATQETRSRLRLDQLDRDLMQSWILKAAERAEGYELLFFDEAIPEDLVEQYVEMMGIMNTAPRDDYEEDDESFTVEELREVEARCELMGLTVLSMVAREKSTGELAGFTNLSYSRLDPPRTWQWGTGVGVAHQNRGLGRWLKAANIETLIDRYPEVATVDTFNATTNEPMLNINFAMGFKPLIRYDVYQGPVSILRDWVEAGRP
jgi:GNAT superfamily N-acetyltransferase